MTVADGQGGIGRGVAESRCHRQLFTMEKFLIGSYLAKAGATSAYGAASCGDSDLPLDSIIRPDLLVGAESTYVYAEKSRSTVNLEMAKAGTVRSNRH